MGRWQLQIWPQIPLLAHHHPLIQDATQLFSAFYHTMASTPSKKNLRDLRPLKHGLHFWKLRTINLVGPSKEVTELEPRKLDWSWWTWSTQRGSSNCWGPRRGNQFRGNLPIVRARGQLNLGLALLGFNTPIGSVFSLTMYLCCDWQYLQNKESFRDYFSVTNGRSDRNEILGEV